MENRDRLTNEDLSKKFKNQFELVSYAIKLAENMIMTGRQPRARVDIQNSAVQILGEIATGQDSLEDQPREFHAQPAEEIIEMLVIEDEDDEDEEELAEEDNPRGRKKKKASADVESKTPRRTRKILVE